MVAWIGPWTLRHIVLYPDEEDRKKESMGNCNQDHANADFCFGEIMSLARKGSLVKLLVLTFRVKELVAFGGT